MLSEATPSPDPDVPGEPEVPADAEAEAELEPGGRGPGPARTVSIIVGVMLVALIALLGFAGGDDELRTSPLLGNRSPEVNGQTLSGGSYNIDDSRGSWVLVNFFATWCPGCINEHDDLVELEQWGSRRGDVELVSVVFNDPVDRVEQFFAERGGSWPVLNNPRVPVDFQVSQIPETFLVSPTGRVVLHVQGEVSAQELIREIEAAG